MYSFAAPDDWGSYQSINLIRDKQAMYALGFYKKGDVATADLILISQLESFEPIMEIVDSQTFATQKGVDFATAAGLQVDKVGKLHIWATQRDARKEIAVHRFSQQE